MLVLSVLMNGGGSTVLQQAKPQTHIKRPVVKRGHNGFSLENDGDVIIVFGGPFIHCNWTYRQTRYSSFTPPVKLILDSTHFVL